MDFDALASSIGAGIAAKLRPRPEGRVHGGSINDCYRWESSAGPIFVKVAPARTRSVFEAESAGLEELRGAGALRVPGVLGIGTTEAQVPTGDSLANRSVVPTGDSLANRSVAWLALEWIRFGPRTPAAEAALGERLALQHRRQAAAFGWDRHNTIGSTPQRNDWSQDWVVFYRDQRLRYQLELAAANGGGSDLQRRGERLLDRVEDFFATYRPVASLLHGDLWGGNWAADENGAPVVFDPALYYGDREADVAMTRLFGGFGAEFYAAYAATWQLDSGARNRTALYNLYHVLNHFNLFGGGYLAQARAMIDELMTS